MKNFSSVKATISVHFPSSQRSAVHFHAPKDPRDLASTTSAALFLPYVCRVCCYVMLRYATFERYGFNMI